MDKDSYFLNHSICPGCGLRFACKNLAPSDRYNASGECLEFYHELTYYTLGKQDPEFIHQLAVDAYGAQHSGGVTKHITTFFALAGLYLFFEKGYTGKQVQQAHLTLAKNKSFTWPGFEAPNEGSKVTIVDVINSGDDRDRILVLWAKSIWESWHKDHQQVIDICEKLL